MVKKGVATWNIQVPKALDKAVDKAIEENWHYTKTEFIRDAVREKLKTLGISPHETFPKNKTEDKNNE